MHNTKEPVSTDEPAPDRVALAKVLRRLRLNVSDSPSTVDYEIADQLLKALGLNGR